MAEKPLTTRERVYIDGRLSGLSQVASAAAAGVAHPRQDASAFDKRPQVQKEMVRRMAKVADEVDFSRKEAHDMLMAAYINADTATEQIAAVREMIKLHGIAEPTQVEYKHTHGGNVNMQLERMEMDELMKVAGMEHLTLEGEFEVIREPELIEHKDDDDDDDEREVRS